MDKCVFTVVELICLLFFFPTVAHSFGKHHLQEIDQLIMQADLQTVNDWLRQGNSVNQEIQDGNRPIHFAAQKGDVQILQALLLSGAEINSVNDEGMTALHIAIQNVQIKAIDLLVHSGARVDIPNKIGQFPIETAIESGSLKIVCLLIPFSNYFQESLLRLTQIPAIEDVILKKIEHKYYLNEKEKKGFIFKNFVLIPVYSGVFSSVSLKFNDQIDTQKKDLLKSFSIALKIPSLFSYLNVETNEPLNQDEVFDRDCPICLEPLIEKVQVTACLHLFHEKCLKTLEESDGREVKCPLCRQSIE